MRKLIPIIAGTFMAFSFSACQKYYSCKCTVYGITINSDWSDLETEAKNYQGMCEQKDEKAQAVGGNCKFYKM